MNKYWGHDGGHLERNVGDVYTNNFDWICCKDKIIKHKPTDPRTIYIKTDYLKKWYKDIVREQDFILICGASEATTLGEWCEEHGRNPIFKPTDDPHKKQKTRVHINLGIDNYLYIHTSLGSRRQKIQIRNIDYNYLSDEFGSQ